MVFLKDEDHDDGKYARYLGVVHVGEIPSQFRQSYLKALRNGFDKICGVDRPVCLDYYYKGIPDDSAPTEEELMDLTFKSRTMLPKYRKILNFAAGIAKDMRKILVKIDKKIAPAKRESLGESIGRNTAKWLLKSELAQNKMALQEEILSDMGFTPIEVTDYLYEGTGKSKRRTISQKISKDKSKRKQTS